MCYGKQARANYFAVRDVSAFEAWCTSLGMRVHSNPHQNPGLVSVFFENGVPMDTRDTTGKYHELDFFQELAPHLADNQVAIILEVGIEDDYLCAYGVAMNADGEMREITLESIYELAQEIAPTQAEIIRAEY
ncbi:hypothetical protein SE18_25800 [Herpetosiphon geysericola]|uniref:Uncharacterized protein n=2 Tax=Herpetosiphon geysericola TaxID=70996 RepID=A0A0P6XB73_9CHLR|nr:hypothetical protein SE18_25800 [Herpetosiphon geysericola]